MGTPSGDIGGAAAQDADATDVQQVAGGELDAAEMGGLEARIEPATQGAPHRFGLVRRSPLRMWCWKAPLS